jgi:4-hydroxy-tetrahydrodipicolinate reductase
VAAPIKVAVAGAGGRMGATVCRAVEAAEDMELVGRADPELGCGVAEAIVNADVLVDFSVPDSALENARLAADAGVNVVIGTTGFDTAALDSITGANVFAAPNFAIGAVLMMRFAEEAAGHFSSAEIVELHHENKIDAPSGTAALTARRMAGRLGGDPPIHSVRLPGIVASQEVIFGGPGETLTIRHDTVDRECFMPGVLLAVRRVGGLESSPVIGLENLL